MAEGRTRPYSAVDCTEDSISMQGLIGKGSYGEVWRAKWNGKVVAAKCLHAELLHHDQEIRDHHAEEFRRESDVLRGLIHPNIIRFYAVLFPPTRSPVIVTELLHCDLQKYIERSTTTPKVLPDKAISISLGIAEGLEYLHGLKPPVVHRDLATKNILLTAEGHPKIADLGVAKVFAAGKDAFATVVPGTPLYSAPETFPAKKGLDFCTEVIYGVKVDIFSFGVVLMVIIIGQEPTVWPLSPIKAGSKNTLISEKERRKKDIVRMGNHKLKSLVLDCLHDKSSKRPTASQICKSIFKVHQELESRKNGPKPSTASCSGIIDTERNPCQGAASNSAETSTFEKIPSQFHYDYRFKVLLLGSSGVGKTCLVERLINPSYNIAYSTATLGIEPQSQAFQYNSSSVHMSITDTAGQERFFAIQPMYFRDVQGVFLVYDVMMESTFKELERWLDIVKQYCTECHVRVLVVGNKIDCFYQGKKIERNVSKERALEFARKHGFPYVETSVLDINLDTIMNMYKKMVECLIDAVSLNTIKIDMRDTMNKTNKVDLSTTENKETSHCKCKR
ncbi:probable serine/threonine-protein kinase PBL3 [Actinia tenebrosa]|uniref:Probable serine/threonine-protein kinase PBL3 n=1 Tax=Actinia tenebrosa TaxID=6105 RepID=A0A6P8IQT5_ACTTE|nr:probable serine/threonine-protein kinase PBL3 [Actinia tenebrosa]